MTLIFFKLKISKGNADSCPISRKTVQIVDGCPDSLEKWNKAAERKNCAAFATQCGEPKKLQYHCVINPFVNETIEVCAYAKNIVLGYCTEYSISGNMIQQNIRTMCPMFKRNPCPTYYRSTEAYKYPGCYELTQGSKNVSEDRMPVTVPIDLKILEKEHEKSDYAWHDWILILCFIINAGNLLALNGLYLCYRMRKRHITNGIEATMEKP